METASNLRNPLPPPKLHPKQIQQMRNESEQQMRNNSEQQMRNPTKPQSNLMTKPLSELPATIKPLPPKIVDNRNINNIKIN